MNQKIKLDNLSYHKRVTYPKVFVIYIIDNIIF